MKEIIKNPIIKEAQRKTGTYNYQVANLLGCSENTFGRMMRNDLPEERQMEIADLIMKAYEEKENADSE